ncbi:RDD family protein [Niabella drilacis]|uniref:RDD family protein n=1 Tax=Niabella drilacis (strain DSM 25811 / CCM 8410 / CCUG 62505 / LMG 26954 / E90) TaxID=1285928 RepID=A0A1G6NFK2_NIADE|nr:RDD family protein [Niabella drilacis]SDC65915.1 RDD family protein [Niabella drilacis]
MLQDPNAPKEFSLFENELLYTRASSGKRLLNLIVDIIIFYILIFLLAFFMVSVSPEMAPYLASDEPGLSLISKLCYTLLYALYMGAMESLLKGKSPGKYITRTRAVNIDGTPISSQTAFLRGLARAVPFCAFSALGAPCDPWQDRWTKTMVVDEREQGS